MKWLFETEEKISEEDRLYFNIIIWAAAERIQRGTCTMTRYYSDVVYVCMIILCIIHTLTLCIHMCGNFAEKKRREQKKKI